MKHADAADAACKVSYLFVFLRARKQIQREFNRTINIVILLFIIALIVRLNVFSLLLFLVLSGESGAHAFSTVSKKFVLVPKSTPPKILDKTD